MKRSVLTHLVYAATLTAGVFAAQQAFAQGTATPRIDQTQAQQQTRIAQGAASGQLTPAEQAKLQTQQSKIATDKAAAKADGVVTRKERHRIKHAQRHADRAIARKKHNHRKTQPAQ